MIRFWRAQKFRLSSFLVCQPFLQHSKSKLIDFAYFRVVDFPGLRDMADIVQLYLENEKADADLVNKIVPPDPGEKIARTNFIHTLRITVLGSLRTSGSMEMEYRDFNALGVEEFTVLSRLPLRQELKDQLQSGLDGYSNALSVPDMQSNCAFGIFPEISRAWMSVDSDLFLWNFEQKSVRFLFLQLF